MISADEYGRAQDLVAMKLSALDIHQERALGHGLAEGELSWPARADHLLGLAGVIDLRARDEGAPMEDELAALAAHAIVALVRLERADTLRVDAGEAA